MELIKPHGGQLVNLLYNQEESLDTDYEITVENNIETDIYNLGLGSFSPLKGFLNREDFELVIEKMRLRDGTIWPIPIVLDIGEKQKNDIENNNVKKILIKNSLGEKIAVLKNEEIFPYNKERYSKKVFGTSEKEHPGAAKIYNMGDFLIGGQIVLLKNNPLKDENNLGKYFKTPEETREIFKNKGWGKIVAFQTRNAPHRSHEYLQKCALEGCDGLFINPVIGKKKKGDFKDEYIIGAYEILIDKYYNKENTFLSILPLTMRYAGPREAILHAIIRQNFGCSHMIVGRDHAGVKDYYGTYEAQEIFNELQKNDLNINILKYEHAGFCKKCGEVTSNKSCPHLDDQKVLISGTEVREKIQNKKNIPEEFMRTEVSNFLINGNNQFVE